MLKGKNVVIAVSGGIAAYKMPNVARALKKLGANVTVLMTNNATNFITPTTFESLLGSKCLVDTFDRSFEFSVEHVSVAKAADVVLVAPATANVIGKIANGIADDMLTTTVMACTCKKIIAPAMNHNMYHNPIVEDNLKKLEGYGYEIIPAERGMLANGDIGDGRMPDEATLVDYVLRECAFKKDMRGRRVLVTAGATREAIDPVRFITNHSSGKMGVAIARAAMLRGASVTLVHGHMDIEPPRFVTAVPVTSAKDMFEKVSALAPDADIIIKAAAVADFTPYTVADRKIKKDSADMSIPLAATQDILKYLGEHKQGHQIIVGFSMETDNVIENSSKKLRSKNCDMICANSLCEDGAGFGGDTNILTLITDRETQTLKKMSKDAAANEILTKILSL